MELGSAQQLLLKLDPLDLLTLLIKSRIQATFGLSTKFINKISKSNDLVLVIIVVHCLVP